MFACCIAQPSFSRARRMGLIGTLSRHNARFEQPSATICYGLIRNSQYVPPLNQFSRSRILKRTTISKAFAVRVRRDFSLTSQRRPGRSCVARRSFQRGFTVSVRANIRLTDARTPVTTMIDFAQPFSRGRHRWGHADCFSVSGEFAAVVWPIFQED